MSQVKETTQPASSQSRTLARRRRIFIGVSAVENKLLAEAARETEGETEAKMLPCPP